MESHIACPAIREIEQQTYDGTLIISKIKPGMNPSKNPGYKPKTI